MPTKPNDSDVLAVVGADYHAWQTPPVARSAEADWLGAMVRPLDQVRRLCDLHGCPFVFAGDLFDRWNPSPECVNAVMVHLPREVYAVPGQHDMRHHNYADLRVTAFWTLVKAGKVKLLKPRHPTNVELPGKAGALRLHGFPYGVPVTPLKKAKRGREFVFGDKARQTNSLVVEVAVAHAYVWTQDRGHPGADESKRVGGYLPLLKGYDVAVFGDNHRAFKFRSEDSKIIWNCGAMLRRKSDEVGYVPRVGLIHADGTVTREKLDCSEDRFLPVEDVATAFRGGEGFSAFIDELAKLGDAALDFSEALRRALDKGNVPEPVRSAVLRALGGERK